MGDIGAGGHLSAPGMTDGTDNGTDAGCDRFTRLASDLLGVPVDILWMQAPVSRVPDRSLRSHPALGPPGSPVHCNEPLRASGGGTLGFICARADEPRDWSDQDRRILTDLAAAIVNHLELQAARRALSTFEEHRGRRTSRGGADVRAAEARQHSFLAAIVEQSEDAILAKDASGVITEWNHGAENLYGYTAEEAIGAPIAMLIPPERAGEDQLLLENVLAGDPVREYETTRLRRDGTLVDVAISISPLHGEFGGLAGASIIARDISARVAQEQARLVVEEQLRITVEHAPIGVGLIGLTESGRGELQSANAPLSALLGIESVDATGQALLSALNPDDAGGLLDALLLLAAGRVSRRELEVRLTGADGNQTWALLAVAPVPTAYGLPPRSAVLHAMDIGDRKRMEGRLQQLADHDSLTGLYNRRRFELELGRVLSHAVRYGGQGALLLIDLDGFKYVNDTMGHSYGDELVTKVAALLSSTLRETDVVARIGGDEFAAIVHHADQRAGISIAEKILQTLREQGMVFSDEQYARVTGSIGLTTFSRTVGLTPEELLVEADVAMYQAKEAGKNQVSVYRRGGAAHPQVQQREHWHRRLRLAIETDGFTLFTQPIRGICSVGVEHHEVLLRMHGEHGELLPASAFLYHAERFDLIQLIDRWVFQRALNMLGAQHRAGRDVALSVNLSGKALEDPRFLGDLASMLAGSDAPPDRLIVEVTETVAITKIDKAREIASGLQELGCRFALDDFGAGFASFYYLKHLDFDFLKISSDVVAALSADPADQLVIRSIVDIARGLGAQTIADGVRDEDTLERLRALGVDYGQGHHLGLPMPLQQALPVPASSD